MKLPTEKPINDILPAARPKTAIIANKLPTYEFILDGSLNITEKDIITHLYNKSTDIIEKTPNRLFLYYFVESIQEDCIHPEKGNSSENSIVLSLPQLYLFPESYTIPSESELKSFEEIQQNITINDVVIEPYNTSPDIPKKYIIKSIYSFQTEFFYIENIRASLTVNEIYKLIDKYQPPTQHGGEKDIKDVYYKTHYGSSVGQGAHDYVPYDLLQKLGVDNFNTFLPPEKTGTHTSKSNYNTEYTNLFSDYFTEKKTRIGYITQSPSTRYFRYFFGNIKRKVIKYITPIFSKDNSILFTDQLIVSVPNKIIARYLCVGFLVEKWIDLYITNKFNLQLYTITKNVQTENGQTETTIDENQYHFIKTTFEYKLEIIKQQLSMFMSQDSVERIFDHIMNGGLNKVEGIEPTYDTYSYYQMLQKELKSFLKKSKENSTQGQIKKLGTEISTTQQKMDENNAILEKTKINQTIQNENTKLLLEKDKLLKKLKELQADSTPGINKSEIIVNLTKFGNDLGEWFRNIDITDNYRIELVKLFKEYIVDFVYTNRTRSRQDINSELQAKLNKKIKPNDNLSTYDKNSEDEKLLVHTNIRRTLDTIIYLLQTVLVKYEPIEVKQTPVTPETIPQTTEQSGPDLVIEGDSDDDFGMDGNNFNDND